MARRRTIVAICISAATGRSASALSVLPESALNTIDGGGIAVVPNFIPPTEGE